MPRKLRVEYPGAIYHVMNRGDQREDIFLDDVDRHDFIKPWPRPVKRPALPREIALMR
jgi:REP-associated tyrosine transposase